MHNLLKVDFKRFLRDKILLISVILVFAFAVINIFIYKIVLLNTDSEMIATNVYGKLLFIESLSPAQNMGIIIPMLLALIVSKDYSNGTVRNKIVSGYSRIKIYLSGFITVLTFGIALYLLNALISLFVGSAVFGYGQPLTGAEVGKIFAYLGLSTLIYSTFFAFATLAANFFKNTVGSIISVLVYVLVVSIFGSTFFEIPNLNGFLQFIVDTNPVCQIATFLEDTISANLVAYGIISSVVVTSGFTALGIVLLKKSDIR